MLPRFSFEFSFSLQIFLFISIIAQALLKHLFNSNYLLLTYVKASSSIMSSPAASNSHVSVTQTHTYFFSCGHGMKATETNLPEIGLVSETHFRTVFPIECPSCQIAQVLGLDLPGRLSEKGFFESVDHMLDHLWQYGKATSDRKAQLVEDLKVLMLVDRQLFWELPVVRKHIKNKAAARRIRRGATHADIVNIEFVRYNDIANSLFKEVYNNIARCFDGKPFEAAHPEYVQDSFEQCCKALLRARECIEIVENAFSLFKRECEEDPKSDPGERIVNVDYYGDGYQPLVNDETCDPSMLSPAGAKPSKAWLESFPDYTNLHPDSNRAIIDDHGSDGSAPMDFSPPGSSPRTPTKIVMNTTKAASPPKPLESNYKPQSPHNPFSRSCVRKYVYDPVREASAVENSKAAATSMVPINHLQSSRPRSWNRARPPPALDMSRIRAYEKTQKAWEAAWNDVEAAAETWRKAPHHRADYARAEYEDAASKCDEAQKIFEAVQVGIYISTDHRRMEKSGKSYVPSPLIGKDLSPVSGITPLSGIFYIPSMLFHSPHSPEWYTPDETQGSDHRHYSIRDLHPTLFHQNCAFPGCNCGAHAHVLEDIKGNFFGFRNPFTEDRRNCGGRRISPPVSPFSFSFPTYHTGQLKEHEQRWRKSVTPTSVFAPKPTKASFVPRLAIPKTKRKASVTLLLPNPKHHRLTSTTAEASIFAPKPVHPTSHLSKHTSPPYPRPSLTRHPLTVRNATPSPQPVLMREERFGPHIASTESSLSENERENMSWRRSITPTGVFAPKPKFGVKVESRFLAFFKKN